MHLAENLQLNSSQVSATPQARRYITVWNIRVKIWVNAHRTSEHGKFYV